MAGDYSFGTTTDSVLWAACGGQGFLGDQQNTLTRVCPCKQLLILAAVTVAKPVVERPPKTVLFYIVFVSYRFQYSSGSRGCCCFAAASQQQHGCFYSIWSARDRDKDVGSIR